MTPTHQSATHIFYQIQMAGRLLNLVRSNPTGEIFFDADSLALGYPDTTAMLANEYALVTINSYAIENGSHSTRWAYGTPIWL
ncbi:hypothetical protein GCM10027190_31760 [Spirosoma areae]